MAEEEWMWSHKQDKDKEHVAWSLVDIFSKVILSKSKYFSSRKWRYHFSFQEAQGIGNNYLLQKANQNLMLPLKLC